MAEVIATAFHPGPAAAVAPLVRRLREDGLNVTLIGYKFAEDVFKREGLEYLTLADLGVDASESGFRSLVGKAAPKAVLAGLSVKVSEDPMIEQFLTSAAKSQNVPSVAVFDGWGEYVKRFSEGNAPEGRWRYLPSKIVGVDDVLREAMIYAGIPDSLIAVTGGPAYDSLPAWLRDNAHKRDDFRDVSGLPKDAFVILYPSAVKSSFEKLGFGYTDIDSMRALCEGIVKANGTRPANRVLAITKHPREVETDFNKLTAIPDSYGICWSRNCLRPREATIAADIMVGAFGTLMIEATMMGKDCISIQPSEERRSNDDFHLNTRDMIPHAYDHSNGVEIVAQALTEPEKVLGSYRTKRNSLTTDGRATDRCVKVIYDLMGR